MPNFHGENFRRWLSNCKFVNIFSLETFPLYGAPTLPMCPHPNDYGIIIEANLVSLSSGGNGFSGGNSVTVTVGVLL